MKSKWFKLGIVFLIFLGVSWMIGHFAKEPWDDRLNWYLVVGTMYWIGRAGLMNLRTQPTKYHHFTAVLLLAVLTILFFSAAIHSALYGGFYN
jgi:hypothetical protein